MPIEQTLSPIVRRHLIASLFVMAFALTVRGDDDSGRRMWKFDTPAGTRTIVDKEQGRWVTYYPNGTSAECIELSRTPEYVEIQNIGTKVVQRLYKSYGAVQKSPGEPFKRFGDGTWVVGEGEDPPPSAGAFGSVDDKIRVVYFVPQDRKPTNNYQEKIGVVLSIISEVMTSDLRSKGLTSDGPQFERLASKPAIHLLHGAQPAREYNDASQFNSIKQFIAITDEVERQLGSVRDHIVLVFAETYEEGPADRVWPGHIARAVAHPPNGGIGVFSAWMLRDEFCATNLQSQRQGFLDPTPILGRTAIGHRGPNSPRFEFIEDGIGGVLHELAHTFGLPHDHRNEQIDLMGAGFRNLRWNVTGSNRVADRAKFSNENAWLLLASRYLNSQVDRADQRPPQVTFDAKRVPQGVAATVNAMDESGLAAIVLVDRQENDRRLITGKKLSGNHVTWQYQLPLPTSTRVDLQVIVVDTGGNHTTITQTDL